MSVSWLVFPISIEVKKWLTEKHNMPIPDVPSRWATLAELIEVLETFEQPIKIERNIHKDETTVSLVVGQINSAVFAQILGTVKDDGYFDFSFERSGNNAYTMLNILKQLSEKCGALVIVSGGKNPFIVTKEINVNGIIETWWSRSSK